MWAYGRAKTESVRRIGHGVEAYRCENINGDRQVVALERAVVGRLQDGREKGAKAVE